jgi:hypothetical protein
MSLQKRAPVKRWEWFYPDSPLRSAVRISKSDDSGYYELIFDKDKMHFQRSDIQDMIDSLQEIIGPPPDKHVAFPEVTEQGVGTDGFGPVEDVT